MASLYAQYLMEKTDDQIIETNDGFVTYRFLDAVSVYIVDIYVNPTGRKRGAATVLANHVVDIAKAKGCEKLIGTVIPSNKNSTDSLRVLLAYGMKLESSAPDLIVFGKGI